MHISLLVLFAALAIAPGGNPAPLQTAPLRGHSPDEPVPVLWLERVTDAPAGKLPAFRPIADSARVAEANRLADNEAARFARRLIGRAWRVTGGYTKTEPMPALPIALEEGGNYARTGLRVLRDETYVEQPDMPYLLLSLDEGSLSLTFLHEGGHVVDAIARRGHRYDAPWSALPHSTFAVTNPTTALGEGYAIHLETLWGHYGNTPARRAWYHRLDPNWHPERAFAGEFLAPVRDLLTFSQNWARYSGVRDGDIAFEGHVYADAYLRSQYSPSRDGGQLRNGNAMLASEGVVAAVLFWIADGEARSGGATPLGGLNQQPLVDAEMRLVESLQRVTSIREPYRADLVDVVAAYGNDPAARRHAVERFVGITRGVSARPAMRSEWAVLHRAAVDLDIAAARKLANGLEAARGEIVEAAVKDPATLRAGIGPVLPVRLAAVTVQLKALGEAFPVEFDLNAAGGAELQVLTSDAALRSRIRAERDARPFASYEDFEQRAGITLSALAAAPIR